MEEHGWEISVSLNGYSRQKCIPLKFIMYTWPMPLMHRSLTILSSSSCQRIQRILFQTWWIICLQRRGIQLSTLSFWCSSTSNILYLQTKAIKHPQRNAWSCNYHSRCYRKGLNNVDIKTFASMVDKDYNDVMMDCVDYTCACEELLPLFHCTFYYGELLHCFPLCHFVFATIVSSHYFSISSV